VIDVVHGTAMLDSRSRVRGSKVPASIEDKSWEQLTAAE
jgi:hypothetical protein